MNEGEGLYAVQRLLGHANAKTTQRYAHLARETLANAAEAMGNIIGPIVKEVSCTPEDVPDDLSSGPRTGP